MTRTLVVFTWVAAVSVNDVIICFLKRISVSETDKMRGEIVLTIKRRVEIVGDVSAVEKANCIREVNGVSRVAVAETYRNYILVSLGGDRNHGGGGGGRLEMDVAGSGGERLGESATRLGRFD